MITNRHHFFCLTFLFLLVTIYGQMDLSAQSIYGPAADSIMSLIEYDEEDSLKVLHLNELGWEVMYYNPDSAILLSNEALAISSRLSSSNNKMEKAFAQKGVAQSYSRLGVYNWILANYDEDITYNFKALEIWTRLNNQRSMASSFTKIGSVYYSQSDYPKALEYFFKALQVGIAIEDSNQVARDFGNIGSVYNELKDYKRSLDYFLKSYNLSKTLKDEDGMAVMLGNLGTIELNLNDLEKAQQN